MEEIGVRREMEWENEDGWYLKEVEESRVQSLAQEWLGLLLKKRIIYKRKEEGGRQNITPRNTIVDRKDRDGMIHQVADIYRRKKKMKKSSQNEREKESLKEGSLEISDLCQTLSEYQGPSYKSSLMKKTRY